MCRLFASSGSVDFPALLPTFIGLSETGKVPANDPAGHKDGWGLAWYPAAQLPESARGTLPAYQDPTAGQAISDLIEAEPAFALGHLRKASVGKISLENTQPFKKGRYSFCHNGTFYDDERLEIDDDAVEGGTDSERVFHFLMRCIDEAGDFREGIIDGMQRLREFDGYTALNICISDGTQSAAIREVNEGNQVVIDEQLCDTYYTLQFAKTESGIIVCSEAIQPELSWDMIPNGSALFFEGANWDIIPFP